MRRMLSKARWAVEWYYSGKFGISRKYKTGILCCPLRKKILQAGFLGRKLARASIIMQKNNKQT
jgi:hypothetical protein